MADKYILISNKYTRVFEFLFLLLLLLFLLLFLYTKTSFLVYSKLALNLIESLLSNSHFIQLFAAFQKVIG